nr:MAG TPA: hypothetical protein [Caudoviricetes sp.]
MKKVFGSRYFTTKDIRKILKEKYKNKDISDNGTIKIVSASFIADKDYIIRKPNKEYQKAEIKWYLSLSRNVNDIAKYYNGKVPKIWQMIADKDGNVNSQYGYRVFSKDFSLNKDKSQWDLAKEALLKDINTRQAILIYTQPEMHELSTLNGMKDWCCTYSQNFKYEYGKLHLVVNMRSNDAVFGTNNDIFWAKYLLKRMAKELNLKPGYIFWHADDLHVYERDFKYLEEDYVL